ncbi:hypothetical protein ACSBR1_018813 [Camellia fascicularis]
MMMMMGSSSGEKAEQGIKGRGLIDVVFSWSLADVLNKDLYKSKIKSIPKTFSSTRDYMKSFIDPLIEETHADLLSSINMVPHAPTCEILAIARSKGHKPPKDLYYTISLKRLSDTANTHEGRYEPEIGDLIALTNVRPRHVNDLNRPRSPYVVALVHGTKGDSDDIAILSSKPIMFDVDGQERKIQTKRSLFAVYVTNMVTNVRVWMSLNSELEGGNMNIIKGVLHSDCTTKTNCTQCLYQANNSAAISNATNAISSFNLDDSQKAAVLSCVATRECHHQNTVKLIWGPPGTGKTKTLASLLFALLGMKCRTLTCAPTNIAVLGVTARLMSLMRDATEYNTYGLGDIVLFGNGERMKIDDHEDLYDVFLDHRVSILAHCFAPGFGWKNSLEAIICLLEDPKELYNLYLQKEKEKDKKEVEKDNGDDEKEEVEKTNFGNSPADSNQDKEGDDFCDQDFKDLDEKEIWRRTIVQTLKTNKNKKKQNNETSQRKSQLKSDKGEDNSTQSKQKRGDMEKKCENLMKFEEFIMKRYKSSGRQLIFYITSLLTHLPTSFFSLEVKMKMIRALDLLKSVGTSLHSRAIADKDLREIPIYGVHDVGNDIVSAKTECLQILKSLRESLAVPNITEYDQIRSFCLQNACLIFCTASSSAKLHTEGIAPLELLVIDEAAQLKECESTIALQLPGLRHAILIGDELQLSAMVQSKICQGTEFGRSLFERLVLLGHKKHLLNVQYRMHPSISSFPNREFYDNEVLDASNVKERTYEKCFLQGSMYGSYSFINVTNGIEDQDSKHSTKNMVEVAVVAEIVSNLFKESVASKQKVRVGCISPYKAQVFALQEKLGKTYNIDGNSDFSVSVRSIDGFQGGEEDLIIISTVRCNRRGSVGFLSNRQRTNVVLTRARHGLWILGNGATLMNSGTVWGKLVLDAKARGCFYNANDDNNLAQAVVGALVELNQLDTLLKIDSPLFSDTRWKVCFGDDFVRSMTTMKNINTCKEVFSLLTKLSSGWREHDHQMDNVLDMNGNCSQLLDVYNVNGFLNLIWSVDIVREYSKYTQVLKVWDVLPLTKIPKLAKRIDTIFVDYEVEKINRCRCKKFEGNLVVPETWPISSTDHVPFLENRVASLSLKDEPGSSNSSR